MRKNSNATNDLFLKINILRNKMICIGETKGLSHPDTLRCSQELDDLIYKYQNAIRIVSFFFYIPLFI